MLKEFVNMIFFGSINGDEGQESYERIFEILDTEYIFLVCGAVPLRDNGLFTTVATYNGRKITAMEAVETIAKNAKYIISVGTCACYGGPTAARPNISNGVSISEFLKRDDIIRIPGCPANPVWTMGILGYITSYGMPDQRLIMERQFMTIVQEEGFLIMGYLLRNLEIQNVYFL